MFTGLFTFISSIYTPSDELAGVLMTMLKKESLPKKTILVRAGDICNRMYFVEKGFVRAFYINRNQEVTSWFMQENEMIISVNSFYNQLPSNEYIELLEDSELVSISFA